MNFTQFPQQKPSYHHNGHDLGKKEETHAHKERDKPSLDSLLIIAIYLYRDFFRQLLKNFGTNYPSPLNASFRQHLCYLFLLQAPTLAVSVSPLAGGRLSKADTILDEANCLSLY